MPDAAHARRILIEPPGRWAFIDPRELWEHRELLHMFAWRDIKVRYQQTALGAAWAILQPLFSMVLFTAFFGKLARMPSDGIPYPIFTYAGLLPWTFFANAVSEGSNSIVGSSSLVTKVYFPRLVVPAAKVVAGLLDFAIASLLLFAMMAWYRVPLGPGLLMLPPLVLLLVAAAFAIGTRLSALNVKYRDIRYALPFCIQSWLFLTPVIYPVSIVPAKWRWMLALNPMTGIIEGFRSAFLATAFAWSTLAISAAVTIVLLIYAVVSFGRLERGFADVI